MRKFAIGLVLAICCSGFVVDTAYANCFYPLWERTEYYQYHQVCGPRDPSTGLRPCSSWWQLDGECYRDCDGTVTCTGDTEVRYNTQTNSEVGICPGVCE